MAHDILIMLAVAFLLVAAIGIGTVVISKQAAADDAARVQDRSEWRRAER